MWNIERKLTHINWPSASLIAERTLVIRCSQWMNQWEWRMLRMLKTEYLSMALRAGLETGGTGGGAGVGSD